MSAKHAPLEKAAPNRHIDSHGKTNSQYHQLQIIANTKHEPPNVMEPTKDFKSSTVQGTGSMTNPTNRQVIA